MKRNNDVRITVRIPKEDKDWLEELAQTKDVSVSHLIRRAVDAYREKLEQIKEV